MRSKEWPLVVFTVLTQMAVGAFLVLAAADVSAARWYGEATVSELVNSLLLTLVLLLAIGGFVAGFHLGQPLRALRVVVNLKTSWLSREMLLGVLFGLSVCLYTVMRWFRITPGIVHDVLALSTAITGIAFVFAMSRLYMLRTIPTWNTLTTPASFFTTTLLLGSVGIGTVFLSTCIHYPTREAGIRDSYDALMDAALGWLVPAVAVLAGIQVVILALNFLHLGSGDSAATANLKTLWVRRQRAIFLRLLSALVGTALFVVSAHPVANHPEPDIPAVACVALYGGFALILVSEISGRFLFYASYRREGI